MKWMSPHQRVIAAWVYAWPGQSIRQLAGRCGVVDPYHSDFHKRLMRMEAAGWLTMHRRWDVFGAPCDIQPTALLREWVRSLWVDELLHCNSPCGAAILGENEADLGADLARQPRSSTLLRSAVMTSEARSSRTSESAAA